MTGDEMAVHTEIDPVLIPVIGKNLEAITREMGVALVRTTSSPFFQVKDMCTAILDDKGAMLCQAEYLPLMAYTFPTMLDYLLQSFGDEIYPGDVFIQNDVFYGGNQLQDLAFFRPVFCEGRLCFWTATKGHQVDLGGPVLGGYNPLATEVWQETVRIPPLKVYERGKLRRDVWSLLMANTRLPELVGRDFQAQIGGCLVGERRVLDLVGRYGLGRLDRHVEALLDSTEMRMREEIGSIPQGVYQATATTQHDGLRADAVYTARMKVIVDDAGISFDFTGTDAQSPGWINGVYATTFSAAVCTFFMCVDPDIPHNGGALRPIKVVVPEGTFLNARYPAATVRGNFTCNDVVSECIMKALGRAIPKRVTAGWARSLTGSMAGVDPRTGKKYYDVMFISNRGGGGGTYGADGWSYIGILTLGGGIRVQDVELHEVQTPHFFLELEYRPDSGGAGEWRGGLGPRSKFLIQAQDPEIVMRGDDVDRPFGTLGGKPGAKGACFYREPGGEQRPLGSNAIHHLKAGTEIEFLAAGGGGFGDPRRRDPLKVLQDVRNGFVTREAAREDYGVAIDGETLEIEWEETRKRRAGSISTIDVPACY